MKGKRYAILCLLSGHPVTSAGNVPGSSANPRCGRRVAILYAAPKFSCRRCLGRGYWSQREGELDRKKRKLHKIWVRLGAHDLTDPIWLKPKGMHQTTFDRLREEERAVRRAADLVWVRAAQRILLDLQARGACAQIEFHEKNIKVACFREHLKWGNSLCWSFSTQYTDVRHSGSGDLKRVFSRIKFSGFIAFPTRRLSLGQIDANLFHVSKIFEIWKKGTLLSPWQHGHDTSTEGLSSLVPHWRPSSGS